MLINPKLSFEFSYQNNAIGIKSIWHSFESLLTLVDPTSSTTKAARGGLWAVGHCYTVINNMIITPISPTLGLSILKNLKVPFYDVINCIVNVGREEVTQCNIFYKFSPLHWSFCNLYRDFKASCHKNFGLHYRLLRILVAFFCVKICFTSAFLDLIAESWEHQRFVLFYFI